MVIKVLVKDIIPNPHLEFPFRREEYFIAQCETFADACDILENEWANGLDIFYNSLFIDGDSGTAYYLAKSQDKFYELIMEAKTENFWI